MVAEHELMVAGTVQARFGHLDCCTAFANWNPAVGSKWVKYSGRWGNEYSDPKVQFGSTSIREFSEPPTRPRLPADLDRRALIPRPHPASSDGLGPPRRDPDRSGPSKTVEIEPPQLVLAGGHEE